MRLWAAVVLWLGSACGRLGFDDIAGASDAGSMRRILVTSPEPTPTVNDVPVLVPLTAATIDYAAVSDPKTDLRFEDVGTGSALPFDVERWDPAGESDVWVRVPSVGTTPATILMYVGRGVGSAQPVASVWADYELVHHFVPTLASSTGMHDAALTSTTLDTGRIGSGVRFAGAAPAQVTFGDSGPLFDGWSEFTLELWLFADYPSAAVLGGEPQVMTKGGSISVGRFFPNGSTLMFQLDVGYTAGVVYLSTPVPPRAWTHVAYVFDGQREDLYVDGLSVESYSSVPASLVSSTLPFVLGGTSLPFTGVIDELRVAKIGRTAPWMRMQFLAMTGQLVSFE